MKYDRVRQKRLTHTHTHTALTSVFPFATQDLLFSSGTSQTIWKERRRDNKDKSPVLISSWTLVSQSLKFLYVSLYYLMSSTVEAFAFNHHPSAVKEKKEIFWYPGPFYPIRRENTDRREGTANCKPDRKLAQTTTSFKLWPPLCHTRTSELETYLSKQ